MTTSQQTVLAESWERLMDCFNLPSGPARRQAFAQLECAYGEPHRHYHNLEHIAWMLDICGSVRFDTKEIELLELATWYHDAVYDTHSGENESKSAEAARKSLRELGLGMDRIARVSELILMTKHHQAPAEDAAALHFLDMDLSILQASPAVYAEYAKAIRQEYAWVADRDFYQGRRQVLLTFLQRPMIFHTERFRAGEKQARANIAAEIARLEELLKV